MQELHVPRLKPAAVDTWELRASLASNEDETARVSLPFPRPYLIVGAHVSVIQTANGGSLLVPTAEDILALVDLDDQRRFTSAKVDGQSSAAGIAAQFVTLAALDTNNRDLHIKMTSPRPELGMTFRWKGNGALYENALISVAFYCTPLEGL